MKFNMNFLFKNYYYYMAFEHTFYKSVLSDFLAFCFLPFLSQPFNGSVDSLARYLMKSSTSRPPSYFLGAFLEFFGAKKIVGKLKIQIKNK